MATADRRLSIAAARAGFLVSGSTLDGAVPNLVAASWRRSLNAGVDSTTVRVAYHDDLDISSRLARCAQPIIDRLRQETADVPVSIALTDAKARILIRLDTERTVGAMLDDVSFAPGFDYAEGHIGTNGVGTVFESGVSVHVVGPEHFHERLQPFSCAGAPIRDPLSGRIEGVLDISCLTEHASPLMHTMARFAVQNIERNLLLDRSQRQQALFEAFVRVDGRARGAVMAVGGSIAMANTPAEALFDPAEQRTIQEHAKYVLTRTNDGVDEIELTTGRVVRIRSTRVVVGDDVAGLVLEVKLCSEDALTIPRSAAGGTPLSPTAPPRLRVLSGGGRSPLWRRACSDIAAALEQHQALLIMGEAGTGKFSLLAETYRSLEPRGRTVQLAAADLNGESPGNAARVTAVPTLYICRGIDALTIEGAQRLNTFLETLAPEPKVRVAATVSEANVDSDLPFREVLVHFQQAVTVPPLRHRTDDLPTVVSQVLARLSNRRETGVSPAAMRVICRYPWPRNVRQLEEALRAALIKRPVGYLQPQDLPGYCHNSARRQLTRMESIERDAIVNALHDAGGNRVQAAAALGIARSSLYRKLQSFGISTI